jgi:hypothetical protein
LVVRPVQRPKSFHKPNEANASPADLGFNHLNFRANADDTGGGSRDEVS